MLYKHSPAILLETPYTIIQNGLIGLQQHNA